MSEVQQHVPESSAIQPVRSPCIGVCALDENDLCIACRRSAVEIGEWGVLSDDQKRAVMARVRQRELADRDGG